jgi:hypothetical protein
LVVPVFVNMAFAMESDTDARGGFVELLPRLSAIVVLRLQKTPPLGVDEPSEPEVEEYISVVAVPKLLGTLPIGELGLVVVVELKDGLIELVLTNWVGVTAELPCKTGRPPPGEASEPSALNNGAPCNPVVEMVLMPNPIEPEEEVNTRPASEVPEEVTIVPRMAAAIIQFFFWFEMYLEMFIQHLGVRGLGPLLVAR